MSLISVSHLRKSYRRPRTRQGLWAGLKGILLPEYETKVALDDVSFSIAEGELVGFIGPNGAGKSTTVKILSGILVPDSGSVEVLSNTPWQERQKTVRELGVVFGQRTQLWWDLPVIESFELLRDIYRVSPSLYKRQLDELIEALDLSPLLSVPVRMLSLGQRMRCDLAASLIHKPKILFLDEPTIGLDAVSKLAIRDFIKRLNREQKVTILLTTHDMDDIEALCKRVLILHSGALYHDGLLEGLRKKLKPEKYLVIDMQDDTECPTDIDATCINKEGHRVWLSYNPSIITTAKLVERITARYEIQDLYIENPPIEELIRQLYSS